jgi:pimeloyl-ACP methyl ester carboxylesterase
MYQVKRAARSEFVPIRNQQYHVLTWGAPAPGRAPLVLVHGWMDVAASWQFMVDAFEHERHVIAPDWRGYGLTTGPVTDSYWFPDYLADLDALIDLHSPDAPVDLVGHSMGGNVAMLYAGVRPHRIRRLVNLEGFGMPANKAAHAPRRLARWLDELKAFHRGEMDLRTYDDAEGVARRLIKTNPRLGPDKAAWLAHHWARADAQGRWRILGDAAHKVINPQLSRVEEVLAIYAAIAAPVLSIETTTDSLSQWWGGKYDLAEYHERLKAVSHVTVEVVSDAGHMVHHDQPELLARLIGRFLES